METESNLIPGKEYIFEIKFVYSSFSKCHMMIFQLNIYLMSFLRNRQRVAVVRRKQKRPVQQQLFDTQAPAQVQQGGRRLFSCFVYNSIPMKIL